ncbi:hypothetical protein [Sneathiella aquimaris]|uniref:hypothetical protein n=1 Tax=Sneathiella aquimaris TaxID=2599305 RepID=UPI00146A78C4|nr:hypothetical protein [Sneathiella aquimaris]
MLISIWLAAVASAVTFVVHFFVGGRMVAAPLLKDKTLPVASKWLNYYCWHVTSVMLIFFIAGFVWLAVFPDRPSVVFLALLSISLSVLSATVALKANLAPWRFPSTSLFAVIAIFGFVAVLAE